MPVTFRVWPKVFLHNEKLVSRTLVDNSPLKVKTGIMMVSRYNHDGSLQHGVTTFLFNCKSKKHVE